jgi:hypothetical protein
MLFIEYLLCYSKLVRQGADPAHRVLIASEAARHLGSVLAKCSQLLCRLEEANDWHKLRRAFVGLSINTRVQFFTSAGRKRPYLTDYLAKATRLLLARGVELQLVLLAKSSLANRLSRL